MFDNVSDIYAKNLTSQLRSIVESDHQWTMNSFPEGSSANPETLEDKPEVSKALLKKAGADTLLSSRLTKGPNGISIKLNLFSATDGKLLCQEVLKDFSGFEVADLRKQLEGMYWKLKSRLPYSGVILSRKGNSVTINMGSLQGLREGQDVSVIQIIKINRHPRFQFIVSAEKEIIGKIHVDKIEESLSFGSISMERSENVVQTGMKLVPIEFVNYPTPAKDGTGSAINGVTGRPDAQVAFGGETPREWVPQPAPSFGQLDLMFGLGTYKVSNALRSAGSVEGSSSVVPSIHLDGELWLTTQWILDVKLDQYVTSISNSFSGSNPKTLSLATMQTSLLAGYNFLISDQFFGPKFQLLGGYTKMTSTIDDSAPTAFTSTSFGGFAMGLAGSFPISEEVPLTLGAKLLYYFTTAVDESPVTSGSSSSGKITSFAAFGTYRWTEHLNWKGELSYDLFSASFTGTGSRGANSASSTSHDIMTFAGGIQYLF